VTTCYGALGALIALISITEPRRAGPDVVACSVSLTGMAKAKWPFSSQPAQTAEAQPLPIPVLSADAKKFGLENVRPFVAPFSASTDICAAVWQYLVRLNAVVTPSWLTSFHSYANSVIQALYFCTPFRDLLIQATDTSVLDEVLAPPPTPVLAPIAPVRRKPERKVSTGDPNGIVLHPPIPGIPSSPPSLFSALRSLFVYISTNPAEKGTVAPRAFIDKLKEFNELFRSTMHQDAHEFLNYLLNKIVEEIEEDRKSAENGTATPPAGDDCESVYRY
jgi:hypothetical protein